MSSASSSAGLHVSRNSTRWMVRQLRHHTAEQRQMVMECRNKAESMSAAAIAHDAHVANIKHPPPFCFVEVATEKDIKQNFIPDGPLSGIAVAVSDALDVQEFHTRSGLDTPMFHHVARKEFPLISWLRRQGAQFVGKMCCRTPLALSEGTVFGPDKPSSTAVFEHACHYAISCSLNGPSSIVCAAYHDIVGFKPTAQTFGTFTERFELTMPSMTLGLSARRVDDLMYLWQVYTASIDPVAYFEQTATKRGGAATPSSAAGTEENSSTSNTSNSSTAASSSSSASHLIASVNQPGATEAREGGVETSQLSSGTTAAAAAAGASKKNGPALTIANWWGGRTVLESSKHPDDTPIYARPEILDHNPYNYTVKDRRGHIADIDVGWRDYNAEAAMADDFGQQTRPGFIRRLLTGAQSFDTPQVELAVGYPAEWIDAYCTGKYSSAAEFHKRITDAVYMHSALHYNQKLEIVPLAFDFTMEEVLEATTIISRYELAKAFERLFRPASAAAATPEESAAAAAAATAAYAKTQAEEVEKKKSAAVAGVLHDEVISDHDAADPIELNALSGVLPIAYDAKHAASPNRPNTFSGLTGVLEELPAGIVESIRAGQKLSVWDYNRALRIRDNVVRAAEEQFMDVDCFLTPLLSDPYESGDLRSVRLTLPFHLAGNPILSVQVDPETPVALIGELGRDAALMEDAFCFLQFVRGASPRWWRQKVFGDSAALSLGAGKNSQPITVYHRMGAKVTPAVPVSAELNKTTTNEKQ